MTTAQHPSRTVRPTADKRNNKQRQQDAMVFRGLVGQLRHRTKVSQLPLRADGSVSVTTLLQLPDYSSFRLEDLQRMVQCQRDVRMEMFREGDEWFIRATRGHSMSHVETAAVSQRRLTDPQEVTACVHGTFWKHWPAIRNGGGLSAMNRNCIHLGQDKVPHKGHELHIYVALGAAMADGYAFYLTAGGYILSPGRDGDGILPTKYFEKVIDARTNEPVPLECDPPPRPPPVPHETLAMHIHRVLPHLTGGRCTTLDDAHTYNSVYQQYDTGHLRTSDCTFFYGHHPRCGDTACLSNWRPATFVVAMPAHVVATSAGALQDLTFEHSEQYMMWAKAIVFNDGATATRLLGAEGADPRTAKKLGRQVQGFDPAVWRACARPIVEHALCHKFQQNPEMLAYLLATQTGTHPKVLVEAAPRDRVWGIGLSKKTALECTPSEWRGTNWLGQVLMRARARLLRADAGVATEEEAAAD